MKRDKNNSMSILEKIRSLIAGGDARTKKLKSNIILSIGLKGVSVLVTFLLVPATIGYVDSEIYGVWLTLAALLMWFQILDIGLAPGLKNKLTEALAVEDYDRGKRLVSTAYMIVVMIFTPLSIVLYFCVPFISWASLLNVDPAYEGQIVAGLRMISVMLCLYMIANVIVSVLAAFQRIAFSQTFLVIGNVVAYIVILILSKTVAPSLTLLVLVLAGAPILVTIIGSIALYCGSCRKVRPSFRSIDVSLIRELLSLGAKFFLINIQWVVVYQTSNMLISHVSSPDMVTAYNIAYRYISLTLVVYTNVTYSLWTACTDAYAKGDREWMQNIRRKMNRLLVMCLLLCFLFAAVANPVYRLWVGDKAYVPMAMTWWVAITIVSKCFMQYNETFIVGTGKIYLETIIMVAGAVIYIPAALFLARWLDQYAILAVQTVLYAAYGMVFCVQTNKLLNCSAKGIWNK
ncbi:MAG: oligosaccharide flippase family protein [Clostridium sp.]|nr:oligosaccharide flippase family protein [Clostridium sp.]